MERTVEMILQICAASSMDSNEVEYPVIKPEETARSSYKQIAEGIFKRVVTAKIRNESPYIFRYKNIANQKQSGKIKGNGPPRSFDPQKLDKK